MADPRVVDYLKQNLEKGYSIDQLKKALLDGGYAPSSIDEAVRIAQTIRLPTVTSTQQGPVNETTEKMDSRYMKVESKERPGDISGLVALYALFFVVNLGFLVFTMSVIAIDFMSFFFISSVVSVFIVLALIIGMYRLSRWALYVGFAFSVFHAYDAIFWMINADYTVIMKLIIHILIMYYLFKHRNIFG